MGLTSWALVGGLLAVILAALGGYRAGAKVTRAEWLAAEQETARAVVLAHEGMSRQAAAAATAYEAERSRRERGNAKTRTELRNTLSAPIQACPGQVGQVVVPAATLRKLRDAGADAPGEAGPAASEPRQ